MVTQISVYGLIAPAHPRKTHIHILAPPHADTRQSPPNNENHGMRHNLNSEGQTQIYINIIA
jgi:hypothetical protein